MKKLFKLSLLIISLIILSCTKDKDDAAISENLQIQDFVWKGLNTYYLWKDDVPDLNDDKKNDTGNYNNFLLNNGSSEKLFQNLLNKPISKFPKGEAVDRFSVIVNDYTFLENLFAGIQKDNGLNFNLNLKTEGSTDVFGWVQYVLPNSDASTKEIKRGDIFYGLNGIALNTTNYRTLLGNDSYTLNMADYDNGKITPNGKTINLTKGVITENSVFIKKVITTGNSKVGYLMYNSFVTNFENDLNNAFTEFKTAAVTDLVLDLRYNGGGSVATSIRLAAMITGQFKDQVFGKVKWNNTVQSSIQTSSPNRLLYKFTNVLDNGAAISSLNLNKVYILTSQGTASASELVINALKPYITVIQVGDVTLGKNVGSITLYDSPNFTNENRSSKHKYAMQPLVIKIANKNDVGDYVNGLIPDQLYKEDKGNLGVLGDETEPLLNKALKMINPSLKSSLKSLKPAIQFENFEDSNSMRPLGNDMHIDNLK